MGILTSEEPSQGLLFLGLQANRTSEITEVRDGRNFRASLESAHTHLAGGKVKVFCTPFTEQVTRLLYTTCTPCSPADDTQHLSLTEWSGGGEDFLTLQPRPHARLLRPGSWAGSVRPQGGDLGAGSIARRRWAGGKLFPGMLGRCSRQLEGCHPHLQVPRLRDRESGSMVIPGPRKAPDTQIAANRLLSLQSTVNPDNQPV